MYFYLYNMCTSIYITKQSTAKKKDIKNKKQRKREREGRGGRERE